MSLPHFVLRDRVPNGKLRGTVDLYNMLYVGFPLGEAAFLIVGGPDRWQGEQYSVARQVPGSPYSWAAVLILGALLLAVGLLIADERDEDRRSLRAYLIVAGALTLASWCVYYAYCLFQAGQDYPSQVSLTGPFLWGFLSLWYVVKVGQHLEFRHPREPR